MVIFRAQRDQLFLRGDKFLARLAQFSAQACNFVLRLEHIVGNFHGCEHGHLVGIQSRGQRHLGEPAIHKGAQALHILGAIVTRERVFFAGDFHGCADFFHGDPPQHKHCLVI